MGDEETKGFPSTPPVPPPAKRRGRPPKSELAKRAEPVEVPSSLVPVVRQEEHKQKMAIAGATNVAQRSEADIRAWVDRKATELLPTAIAELNYNLKYGTEKQRAEAVDRVLDMHGLRKREAAAGQHASIVLHLDNGTLTQKLPWLARKDKPKDEK